MTGSGRTCDDPRQNRGSSKRSAHPNAGCRRSGECRQEAARRCSAAHARRIRRRSSSDVPPHTPESWLVTRANSRQSLLASHVSQTALADSICSIAGPVVPTGKKRSGSVSWHAANDRQLSSTSVRLRISVNATCPPGMCLPTRGGGSMFVCSITGGVRIARRVFYRALCAAEGPLVNLRTIVTVTALSHAVKQKF